MPTKSGQPKPKQTTNKGSKPGAKTTKKNGVKSHLLKGGKAVAKPSKSAPKEPQGPPLPKTVPTAQEIATKTATLSGSAKAAFDNILNGLTEHLGSLEAARLWLVTPSPQFDTTPLDAILIGEAEAVLSFLESRWGLGPVYA